MKPLLILAVSAACLALPAASLAGPLLGATAPSPDAGQEKAFCMKTKNDPASHGACLFTSYQECKTSVAAIYAECYRNPRMAHAQGPKKQ